MNQKVPYGFVYETVNKLNGMKYIAKIATNFLLIRDFLKE